MTSRKILLEPEKPREIWIDKSVQFSWRIPKPAAILILDAAGSDLIREVCGALPTHVLDREKLNIPVLLATVLRGQKSMREYQNSYIRRVKPQLIITLIDNDLYFLTLKSTFPAATTIAIQNGIRANYAPRAHSGFFSLLEKAESPSCDYYCVFNHQVGTQLGSVIETTPVVTGSLKNNKFQSTTELVKPFSIAFVSQHPPRAIPGSSEGIYFGNSFVPDRDFYQADFLVANYLARLCSARKFEFIICGKRDQDFSHEFAMFSEAIGDHHWTYAPRTNDLSTYETLDNANLVVSVDSTLGYEFLARR
ncbi:MAG: LA_1612 family putative O-antigen biosynthesis protein, partial [Ilumatobacteraceae bacterium]